MIHITECSVSILQNLNRIIPIQQKIDYINSLMVVGFDVLNCGYFSDENITIISQINKVLSKTKISIFITNTFEAEQVLYQTNVDILNFTVTSSTLSKRDILQLRTIWEEIKEHKQLNIYINMDHNWQNIAHQIRQLMEIGVMDICLLDNTKKPNHHIISPLFQYIFNYPNVNIGIHFSEETSLNTLKKAYNNGCKKFETTIKGLDNNLSTEKYINFILREKIPHSLNLLNFEASWNKAKTIFNF